MSMGVSKAKTLFSDALFKNIYLTTDTNQKFYVRKYTSSHYVNLIKAIISTISLIFSKKIVTSLLTILYGIFSNEFIFHVNSRGTNPVNPPRGQNYLNYSCSLSSNDFGRSSRNFCLLYFPSSLPLRIRFSSKQISYEKSPLLKCNNYLLGPGLSNVTPRHPELSDNS